MWQTGGKCIVDFISRAHFSHKDSSPRLNICLGDVFFVTDTLHEDAIGSWYACKLSRSGEVVEKGVIPSFDRQEREKKNM